MAFFFVRSSQLFKSPELYPIIENNRWGFIDETGKKVIPPKFHSIGQFVEGLAPARLDGVYGFIDAEGDWAIDPMFDFAKPFQKGLAEVYVDGKSQFINKQAKLVFNHDYRAVEAFDENDFAQVSATQRLRYGLINRKGELVLDTIYSRIKLVGNGFYIVEEDDELEKNKPLNMTQTGVIKPNGRWLVPCGKYINIEYMGEGVFEGEFKLEKGYGDWELFQEAGNVLFHASGSFLRIAHGANVYDGQIVVAISEFDRNGFEGYDYANYYSKYEYKGVMNLKGEVLIKHPHWKELLPFKNGLSFMEDSSSNWHLIDFTGRTLNTVPLADVRWVEKWRYSRRTQNRQKYESLFLNGWEVVKTDTQWGVMDKNGNFRPVPKVKGGFNEGELDRREGNKVYFTDDRYRKGVYEQMSYYWDVEKDTIVVLSANDINIPSSGLKPTELDDKSVYLNSQGQVVWQELKGEDSTQKNGLEPLNIDYMLRGYGYASSPNLASAPYNGWGRGGEKHDYQPVSDQKKIEKTKGLTLYVDTLSKEPFHKNYQGFRLTASNFSGDTLYFQAQDSRLYLVMQAKTAQGKWTDIEYTPSSWCGNSYHTLFLPDKHQWDFTVPVYEGTIPVQLRVRLWYHQKEDRDAERFTAYSNEFDGAINPAQLWRKQGYSPSGIMDTYVD
ncbi:MAG: WG repeat-containing protein [Flammeovirgaceae bacterium]